MDRADAKLMEFKLKKKEIIIPFGEIAHTPLTGQVSGIPGVTAASGVTSIPTQIPNQVTGNLTITGTVTSTNLSGTNTGDETIATIKSKLGAASAGVDGYLKGTDWSTFNNKADKGLSGVKTYYVSDTSGGPTDRKLTFTDGILTSEI